MGLTTLRPPSCSFRSQPEEIYKLMYHNEDFLRSIWDKQGFRGEHSGRQ